MKQILALTMSLVLAGVLAASAQSPGSESVYGGSTSVKSIISGGTSADVSESLYIGPGTHQIDGTWEIYAQRIIIDPLAVVTGTGSIQIYNPGDLISIYPAAVSMATLIDGNAPSGTANNIDVNIQHFNNAGIQLTNMSFPSDLIIDGWMNNTISSSLYVGKDLSLEVDGADVTLGTGVMGDLRFDADATISNYRPERMVIVNNSILSHVVKENYTSAFTFPVGIADGDYTPAQISNASSNTVRVSVQDYTASTSPEATTDPGPGGVLADGMQRTWHIYADNAGISSTVNLQHNSTSNQSGFTDPSHFVTQWGSTTPNATGDNTIAYSSSAWQSNNAAAGATGTLLTGAATLTGSSMRSRTYASLATTLVANESYFTKSSDPFHPLPVKLLGFAAQSNKCAVVIKWQTGSEDQMKVFNVQHSTDGRTYTTIASLAPKGSNSDYSYMHTTAATGKNFYRISMVEASGEYSYSPTQTATTDCDILTVAMNVYPNPTKGQVTIEGMGHNTQSIVRVLNLHGQIVKEMQTANNAETLDISFLASASYLIQVLQNNEIKLNVKLVKD